MKIDSLVRRRIVFESDDGAIRVVRSRTSAGACAISITFGKQIIEVASDVSVGRPMYEHRARELAELIFAACDDPCLLPSAASTDEH